VSPAQSPEATVRKDPKKPCPNCGTPLPPDASYCPKCGEMQPDEPSGRSGHRTARRGPPELYPEDVVPPTSGISASSGVAILLAVLVVILLVLMVSGYNQAVPYLHPASNTQATIVGDRLSATYSYVSNGSSVTSTIGTLCPNCPMDLTTGSSFTYKITLANTQNASIELTSISTEPPFKLSSYQPSQQLIVAGLSQSFTLTLVAPTSPGLYTIPLVVAFNVA
jgi:ribosomal protein L40E